MGQLPKLGLLALHLVAVAPQGGMAQGHGGGGGRGGGGGGRGGGSSSHSSDRRRRTTLADDPTSIEQLLALVTRCPSHFVGWRRGVLAIREVCRDEEAGVLGYGSECPTWVLEDLWAAAAALRSAGTHEDLRVALEKLEHLSVDLRSLHLSGGLALASLRAPPPWRPRNAELHVEAQQCFWQDQRGQQYDLGTQVDDADGPPPRGESDLSQEERRCSRHTAQALDMLASEIRRGQRVTGGLRYLGFERTTWARDAEGRQLLTWKGLLGPLVGGVLALDLFWSCLLSMLLLLALVYVCSERRAARLREPAAAPIALMAAEEYLRGGSNSAAAASTSTEELNSRDDLPSGTWRGWYDQYGYRHQVCEFTLCFEGSAITGAGVDDVGAYEISGTAAPTTRRIAFEKQYIRDSLSSSGRRRPDENHGHLVEYRGEWAGLHLGQGVRGTWYIRTESYSGSGRFHMWPAMEDWKRDGAAEPREVFEVTEDNICVVCYDKPIDTLLDPCGHIAVCSLCARRLPQGPQGHQRCPICSLRIDRVLPARPRSAEAASGGDRAGAA